MKLKTTAEEEGVAGTTGQPRPRPGPGPGPGRMRLRNIQPDVEEPDNTVKVVTGWEQVKENCKTGPKRKQVKTFA